MLHRGPHLLRELVFTDDAKSGLAYAVKLESLRRLRADRPDVEVVRTVNAEHNTAMRAVNTKAGFVPVATLTTTVLTL